MMKNKRNSIVAAVMLLISPALMAQDTLRTDVIDVVKNYNATLSDAIKIKVLPNPEIPEFKAPNPKYTLPAAQLALAPTFTVAKPLFMGSSALPKLKNNYTKLSNMQHLSKLFFRVTIPKVLFSENLFLPLPVFSRLVFYGHYNVLKPCILEDKLTIAIYISQ